MKKVTLRAIIMATLMLMIVMSVYAATTKVLVATEPGVRQVQTFGIGKPVHLEAIGCLPAASTVMVYRVSGAVTNAMVSAALSDGAYNAAISTTNYLLAGDSVIFGGSYTSGVVRLIVDAD